VAGALAMLVYLGALGWALDLLPSWLRRWLRLK
jgi:hypothetical protein